MRNKIERRGRPSEAPPEPKWAGERGVRQMQQWDHPQQAASQAEGGAPATMTGCWGGAEPGGGGRPGAGLDGHGRVLTLPAAAIVWLLGFHAQTPATLARSEQWSLGGCLGSAAA